MQRARSTPAQRAGDAAEDLAAARLAAAGWTILSRNLRLGRDELDIVAVDPGPPAALVVVEVRRRGRRDYGVAEETLGWPKRRALRRAVGALLGIASLPDGRVLPALPVRVDLVALDPGSDGRTSVTAPPRDPPVDLALQPDRAGPCATLPAAAARPRWSTHARTGARRLGAHTRITARTGRCPPAGRRRAGSRAPAGDPRRHQPQEVTQCPPSRCASCSRPASTSDTRPAAGTPR